MDIAKVNAILEAIKEVDEHTCDHLERTAMFTCALAKALKLKQQQLEQSYFAGLLHDIGVLGAVERDQQQCAKIGSVILQLIDDNANIISKAIKHQHDFYLQEEENDFALLLSEMIAISSKYDEMRNVEGLQHEQALELLKSISGFNSDLIDRFDVILKEEELI